MAGYPPSLSLNLSCNWRHVILTLYGRAVMPDTVENQIRKALWECAYGHMSLDAFRACFVPLSWNIEESGEPLAIALAHDLDGILAEASSGGWTEDELLEELRSPFVANALAESVVGDPSPFPIPQSSTTNFNDVAA